MKASNLSCMQECDSPKFSKASWCSFDGVSAANENLQITPRPLRLGGDYWVECPLSKSWVHTYR